MGLAVLAALAIGLSVTHKIFETDFWQHLLVGKVIWTTGSVPTTQLWSWPTYGTVDTTSSYSWLFRFLVFPFWSIAEVEGLFLWRWLTTLAAFALLWKTARALGARGPSLYLVLIACALVYRQRSQVRPETLAAVLLAATLLILERRRAGGRDRSWWLVPVMWLWVNAHVSFYVGFVLLTLHALGDLASGRRSNRRPLWPVLVGGVGVAFLNPYGLRALWQPFHYLLVLRHEDLYRSIGEIQSLDWHWNLRNGFPLVLASWIALQAWRARRGRADPVEMGGFLLFTAQALAAGRFLGFWALIAAPYLARGLHEWLAARRWRGWRARAAGAVGAASCAGLLLAEWTRPDMPFGVGLVPSSFPGRACDFIAAHGVRGRALNSFEFGGYLLWRFWPDPSRLPFMDIHQAGTATERHLYVYAHARPEGWAAFQERYRPDFVLARRLGRPGDSLKDFLDSDVAWALVFADDAAALFVRRSSAPAEVLEHRYTRVPGGKAALQTIYPRLADSTFRRELRGELDRMVAASPLNSIASSFRGTIHLQEGRLEEAERDFEHAHQVDPLVPGYHYSMGRIALARGDLGRALRHYRAQQRVAPIPELELSIGQLHQRLGRRGAAIRAYRRLVESGVRADEARDSLRSLGAGSR